jgi:DNA-binding PadR family transcriptional regulator
VTTQHPTGGGRLPVTTFAVLGQVASGPTTGYDIKARLEAGAAQLLHASYSQIYAELRRLESLGYVAQEHVVQAGRPNKRVYSITAAGQDALRDWVAEPWGLAQLRDEALVKRLLADVLPVSEVIAHVEALRDLHERRRADFERRIAALPDDSPRYAHLALRKGVLAQAAFAAWCAEVNDELSASD